MPEAVAASGSAACRGPRVNTSLLCSSEQIRQALIKLLRWCSGNKSIIARLLSLPLCTGPQDAFVTSSNQLALHAATSIIIAFQWQVHKRRQIKQDKQLMNSAIILFPIHRPTVLFATFNVEQSVACIWPTFIYCFRASRGL